MANFKRGRIKDSRAGCLMCKSHKANAEVGRERRREQRASAEFEDTAENGERVSNGRTYDVCPDCNGTGRCPNGTDCRDENCYYGVCPLCYGEKVYATG
jgi:hypothetical protein